MAVIRMETLPVQLRPPVTGMGFMWMETESMMVLQILTIALLSTEEEAAVILQIYHSIIRKQVLSPIPLLHTA